jgi:purine catabolism regulator
MYRERGITVEEILKLDILKGAKIIAGAGGLDRVVSGVNVMEVPDIFDWVKKGEFILTAAYAIRNDPEAQIMLIPEFNNRGLAGLGIKTKRYVESLPDRMLEIADELSFPIIELPLNVSFTDIINPILTNIVNKQTALLLKIDDAHQKFMNVLLEGGGLQEVARVLNQLVINPLVIENIIFGNRYSAGDKDFLSKVDVEKPDTAADFDRKYEERMDRVNGREVMRRTLPIITGKRVYGYIHIWEAEKPIAPMDLRIIEDSLAVTALEIAKQISIFEVERKYKNEFLEDLLSGDPDMCRIALERATFFGLDLNRDYVAVVLKIKNLEGSFQRTVNNAHYFQFYKNSITRVIDRELRGLGCKYILGNKSDQITILLSVDRGKGSDHVKQYISNITSRIYDRITAEVQESRITIATGKYFSGHENIWRSYNTALKALTLSKYLGKEVVHFEDLGIYRLLCNENIQPELETFFRDNLQPLLKYDRTRNGELIKTLETYFNANGNLKKVSELMFTHYNTILYRIQKIQELTNTNLNDPYDRLNLQVALSIMHINNC